MKRIVNVKGFEHTALWEKIIDQWIKNNLAYIQQTNARDCIYWHNERANVGALLGAIWQVGGVGTIEFEAIKDAPEKSEGKKEGQIDLYFKLNDIEYFVEAKFLRDEKITNPNVEGKMGEALGDILKLFNHNTIEHTMSLVFIVPKDGKNIESICKKLYPNEELNIFVKLQVDEKLKYNENTYRTVYLLGKYCRKGEQC
jgi:hypothetical protein